MFLYQNISQQITVNPVCLIPSTNPVLLSIPSKEAHPTYPAILSSARDTHSGVLQAVTKVSRKSIIRILRSMNSRQTKTGFQSKLPVLFFKQMSARPKPPPPLTTNGLQGMLPADIHIHWSMPLKSPLKSSVCFLIAHLV